MKVILREDVQKLGNKGEIVEVKAGFARNFLLIQKFADIATEENIQKAESLQRKMKAEKKAFLEKADDYIKKLSTVSLEIAKKANEKDFFYEQVSADDITKEAVRVLGVALPKVDVSLAKKITRPGEYKAEINFGAEKKATVKVIAISIK